MIKPTSQAEMLVTAQGWKHCSSCARSMGPKVKKRGGTSWELAASPGNFLSQTLQPLFNHIQPLFNLVNHGSAMRFKMIQISWSIIWLDPTEDFLKVPEAGLAGARRQRLGCF